jgi:hypothetical protein
VSDIFEFSKKNILNSITNPSVKSTDYLDFNSPFSFFDFIKYSQNVLNPASLNNLYQEYLNHWKTKKQSVIPVVDTIQERYLDFIKDITLNYTSLDEKRFLANINFDDPSELDIVLPFYSQKIVEICNFYNDKRHKLKNKLEKNKSKGSFISIEKSIYETITDTVFIDVLEIGTYQPKVDYKKILKDLDIEIEELYDLYSNYLDNNPNETYNTYDVKTKVRQDYFTANLNNIDAYIFINLDLAIRIQLLENVRIFLTEFGRLFTINYDISTINLNCKPNDKLYNLVTNNKPKASRLVDLKNSLIRKYIGTDFYYIQTGTTVTGITEPTLLFKADNPTGNLLNRHFPTTASVEEESHVESCRRIGLFFTPEKNSILYYSVPDKKYKIDYIKLEPNKLYIFPDPNRYGNTLGLTRKYDTEYPLIHVCDYTRSVKGVDQGLSEGDINTNPYTQDYFAYFSKNQLVDSINLGKEGLQTNFSSIHNSGIVTKWCSDIFGNQFSLFKHKKRKNLVDSTYVEENNDVTCEIYDGGPIKFFGGREDSNFLPEEEYSSEPDWVKYNVFTSNYYYNILIGAGIGGIKDGIPVRSQYKHPLIIDGLMINEIQRQIQNFDVNINQLSFKQLTIIEGNQYNLVNDNLDRNTIIYSWDLNENNGYNTTIDYNIDGLRFSRNPSNLNFNFDHHLDGNPLLNQSEFASNFNYDYVLSSVQYKEFDAGLISDTCNNSFNFEEQTKLIIQQTLESSKTVLEDGNINEKDINSFELRNSKGKIYVRDIVTGNITSLSSALSIQLLNRYSDIINFEINNKVIDFNVFNNFLWIKTENYLLFEKINYNNIFAYSEVNPSYINYSNGVYLDNISNPFIFEKRDYCMIVQLSGTNTSSNNFCIIPIIYKINYGTLQKTKIFPLENTNISIFENDNSVNDVKLAKIETPVIVYNSRNDKYCILNTLEDQNQMVYVYKIFFNYNGIDVYNLDAKLYRVSKDYIKTINFIDNPSLNDNNLILNDIINNTTTNFDQGVLTFS